MRILVVIQKQVFRQIITQALNDCGHEASAMDDARSAWELLQTASFPVVVTDVEVESATGGYLTTQISTHMPQTQVIITSPHPSSMTEAVQTLRSGSYSYLINTFEDVGLVSASLSRAIDNVRAVSDLRTQIKRLGENAQILQGIHKNLKRSAARDTLTGLHDQLHFHESLGRELIRSLQYNRPFSLILIEIHTSLETRTPVRQLQEKQLQLAQALKSRFRRSDLITLYRPDTFGLLLPETDKDAATYVVNHICELVEHFPFNTLEETGDYQINFCYGSATCPDDGRDTSILLQQAENALKSSRQKGGHSITQSCLPPLSTTEKKQPLDFSDTPRRRILVVAKTESLRGKLSRHLEKESFEVTLTDTAGAALEYFDRNPYPVVVADLELPDASGMDLLQRVKRIESDSEVVLITDQAALDASIAALRAGAFDCLHTPADNLAIVPVIIGRAFENFCRIHKERRLIAELERKNKGMALANKSLQEQVIRDGLTGLYNHSYFKEALEVEIVRSRRYGRVFSLLFMDLDHFKNYNDSCGHQAGDRLLQTFATEIGSVLRKSDIVARYGGEEFTVILPELSPAESFALAEDIRAMIESYPFAGREKQPGGKVTLTIGIANYPSAGEDAETLTNCADQALYRGKDQGRNRVVAFEK